MAPSSPAPAVVVDPAWEAVCSARSAQLAQLPGGVDTVEGIRAATAGFLQLLNQAAPNPPEGMEESTHTFTYKPSGEGEKEEVEISVIRHVPANCLGQPEGQRATIVYAHGGGLIAGTAALSVPITRRIAQGSGCQVFSVEYRLAPESKGPAAAEDVLATVRWLRGGGGGEEGKEFGVDPKRIVVMGSSGGACAVAGAALMARDQGKEEGQEKEIAGLLLEYPMLDDRTKGDEREKAYHGWGEESNDVAWGAYTGVVGDKEKKRREEGEEEGISYYAAPARCGDLSGLPPTFVNVTGLDLFKRESVAFVGRLVEAGVEVEFHMYPGVGHAFDLMLPEHRYAKAMAEDEFRFIGKF